MKAATTRALRHLRTRALSHCLALAAMMLAPLTAMHSRERRQAARRRVCRSAAARPPRW